METKGSTNSPAMLEIGAQKCSEGQPLSASARKPAACVTKANFSPCLCNPLVNVCCASFLCAIYRGSQSSTPPAIEPLAQAAKGPSFLPHDPRLSEGLSDVPQTDTWDFICVEEVCNPLISVCNMLPLCRTRGPFLALNLRVWLFKSSCRDSCS